MPKTTTMEYIPSFASDRGMVPAKWRATVTDGFTIAIGEGRTPQEAAEEAREIRMRRTA